MLYGYREVVDNRLATLVVGADTGMEYKDFFVMATRPEVEHPHFQEVATSSILQHMQDPLYQGYKMPIYVFYHSSEDQRDAFVLEWGIREVPPVAGRDRQSDMTFADHKATLQLNKQIRDAAEAIAEENGEEFNDGTPQTIEEIYGLDEEDRWDRRSEEEQEQDRIMREKLKQAQREGKVSDDSFSGGKHGGNVHVTDINTQVDAAGNISVSGVRAMKVGGEVDEDLKAQNIAAHEQQLAAALGDKKRFTPEDFAAILRGDGSADHMDHRGDADPQRRGAPIERSSLSDAAATARQEYQEQQAEIRQQQEQRAREQADQQALEEQQQNVFRGADLAPDYQMSWDQLPQDLQELLTAHEAQMDTIGVKDYPHNSQLAGRALVPFDDLHAWRKGAKPGDIKVTIMGAINIRVEGTIGISDVRVGAVSKEKPEQPGWVVYERHRVIEEDGKLTSQITRSLLRIR